jgi:hypothetical protein
MLRVLSFLFGRFSHRQETPTIPTDSDNYFYIGERWDGDTPLQICKTRFYLHLIISILLFCCQPAQSEIRTAATADYADVLTAYNACSDGDELSIPPGTNTWTSTLTVAKAIWIYGASSNTTRIVRSGTAIKTDGESGGLAGKIPRISNIYFDGNNFGGSYTLDLRGGNLTTNYPTYVRVDHCYFNNNYVAICVRGPTSWGVIDHCVFRNSDFAVSFIGNGVVWDWPISPGNTNMMVIEDCHMFWEGSTMPNDGNETISTGQGERFVARYCTFTGTNYTGTGGDFLPFETHGKGNSETWPPDPDSLRAAPIFELYMNTMRSESYRYFHIRGGSYLAWSNTIIATDPSDDAIVLAQDAAGETWPAYDQVANSFMWGNTFNGVLITNITLFDPATDLPLIQENRDYWMHAPDATSGRFVWTDGAGGPEGYLSNNTAQAYYPYTPLTYPHPLVTAQDGGGGGGGDIPATPGTRALRMTFPR